MVDLYHEMIVNASPERVYDAITTQDGLRGWWTADSTAEPKVGTVAQFGFTKRKLVFRMRIDELVKPKRVVWSCLGDWEEWVGTRLTWEITPEEGGTKLRFIHAGWRSTDGVLASCNSTWGELMTRLKGHVEGKPPYPGYVSGKAPGPRWLE